MFDALNKAVQRAIDARRRANPLCQCGAHKAVGALRCELCEEVWEDFRARVRR